MATASPAQIAARKAFVAKVRAGAFKKKAPKRKKNPQQDFAQPAAPVGPKAHRKMNPAKRQTVVQKLADSIMRGVNAGIPLDVVAANVKINYGTERPTKTQLNAALKIVRRELNFPDPIRVTKRGVVRRNPVGRNSQSTSSHEQWNIHGARKKNPTSPAHRSPSMFCVHRVKADGEPGALLAKFPSKPLAVEYAKAYASAHKQQVGIIGKA